MISIPQVLVICPNATRRDEAIEIVRHIGLHTASCGSLTDARALVERQTFQFVLCNDDLPDCNLRTSVRVLQVSTGGIPVIVLSHLADWEACLRALSAGAFDYIVCPPDPGEAERIMRIALERNALPQRAASSAQ